MYCTAGAIVAWALTMVGVPEDGAHRKIALACYESETACLGAATGAENAVNRVTRRKVKIDCEREPRSGGDQ